MRKFKVGDRVRFKRVCKFKVIDSLIDCNSIEVLKNGDFGTIVEVRYNDVYFVKFDKIEKEVFVFVSELEPVDDVFELIRMTREVMKK